MRFGLIIRGQYPQGDDMRVRLKEDLDAAKFAEQLGYDMIGKGSHYSSYPFQYIQQIPYLCQVALIAPKLRLCPGVVLLPLHSPLHVAEELASLDVMCDGKLIFGAGIGYREVEFNAFNTTQKQSGKRFEECLTAVKRLWSEDFVTMEASYFKLDNANCTVMPVQKPMPPVWIAASTTPETFVAAGRAGRSIMSIPLAAAKMGELTGLYRDAWRSAGHPGRGRIMLAFSMCCMPTAEEAIAAYRGPIDSYMKALLAAASGWVEGAKSKDYVGYDKMIAAIREESFDSQRAKGTCWAGSPEEIRDMIADYARAVPFEVASLQVNQHMLPLPLAKKSLALFAEAVAPHFAGRPAQAVSA